MHLILCDEIDSGKSTFVLELTRSLIEKNKKISGWITPAHMDGEKKSGHDFITIDKGKFSERIPFTRLHEFENSFRWRRFHFSRTAFDIAGHLDTDCDLFIMDEIGPLELEEGQGFYDTMNEALAKSKSTLIVARTDLKATVSKLIVGQGVRILDLNSSKLIEIS